MGSNGKIFTTIKEMVEETGLPYKRIYNDIKNNILPATKRGNRYYIYTSDSSKYILDIIAENRKYSAEDATNLIKNLDVVLAFLGGKANDKPKN